MAKSASNQPRKLVNTRLEKGSPETDGGMSSGPNLVPLLAAPRPHLFSPTLGFFLGSCLSGRTLWGPCPLPASFLKATTSLKAASPPSSLPCPPSWGSYQPSSWPRMRSPSTWVILLSCSHLLERVFEQFSSVQSLSSVWLFVTPWTAACQASLSITNSWSLLKLMSIDSVMPSNHLILCRPLLLLPSVFPSIRVFSKKSALSIRWPKYWSFSFNISPSNEYLGVISFRRYLLDLLAAQGTLRSLLQHHSSKASILQCSAFFVVQLSHLYMTTGKTIALTSLVLWTNSPQIVLIWAWPCVPLVPWWTWRVVTQGLVGPQRTLTFLPGE